MPERHIGPTLRRLSNIIKREVEKSAVKQQIDHLTGLHGWVIRFIAEQEGAVFQRDLEKRFSCRRSTMSNILSLMEKNGFIERRRSENDARLKELVLTDKAREIHEMAKKDMLRMEEILSRGIDEKELEIFFNVADKIRANIERQEKND